MKRCLLVLAAAVCLLPLEPTNGFAQMAGGPPTPTDTSMIKNKFLDIAYAGISKTQTLDIYLPDSGKGPFPAIICIHGGGFAFGDNRGAELAIALKALDRGYAVVSVNYRMSGEAPYPAAINDVSLDRWLK